MCRPSFLFWVMTLYGVSAGVSGKGMVTVLPNL